MNVYTPTIKSKKFKIKGLLIVFSLYSLWFIFLINQLMSLNNQKVILLIIITFIFSIIVSSTYKAYNDNDLLQPIVLINIFVFFIFVARPTQLIWSDAILKDDHVFSIYRNLYGISNFNELTYVRALSVGLIGIVSIYAGYYIQISKGLKKLSKKKEDFNYSPFLTNAQQINNGVVWYRFFLLIAGISCTIFFLQYDYSMLISHAGKLSSTGISYSTINIIWIYIGTCALIYSFLIRGKLPISGLFIIIAYIILIAATGKRAYIVNLLLSILVLTYYVQFKKKINTRFIFWGLGIFTAVLIYGYFRTINIGRALNDTIIDNLLSEFSMFDMLLVSIDYENYFGKFPFQGYHYLSIFNGFLPSSIWPWRVTPFDHAHTKIIFKGVYGGAVPTSLFGSLYLNFSYIGVIIGCFIFGKVLKKVFNRLKTMKTRFSIGLYALFTTFVYDIIRVGDIGREFWTFMVYVGVYYIMWIFIKPKKMQNLNYNKEKLTLK